MHRFLNVYGLLIAIGGDWPSVIDNVALDFGWFEVPMGTHPARVHVEIRRGPPELERFGDVPAAFVTPRNVVYQLEDTRTLVDYFGTAVSVYDRSREHVLVQGEPDHLVHEAAYHFLLSRIGSHVEQRRMTRLHALALVGRQGAVALMLPSGGGKSTLALRALREPGVKLLAEDSPLIDRRGFLHPFPLRIGVNPSDAGDLPDVPVRRLERMEFHPKLALDIRPFAGQIETEPQPLRHLVVGHRTLGDRTDLRPLARRGAVGSLMREAVVGVGIYQGMEFVLQRGIRDLAGKAGIGLTRALCCAAALSRARVWRLTVGRDRERNWSALRRLLTEPEPDGPPTAGGMPS
ncbi:MAG: hypothetical protein ACJ76S_01325 [Solirubrobacteraceae bacterium]